MRIKDKQMEGQINFYLSEKKQQMNSNISWTEKTVYFFTAPSKVCNNGKRINIIFLHVISHFSKISFLYWKKYHSHLEYLQSEWPVIHWRSAVITILQYVKGERQQLNTKCMSAQDTEKCIFTRHAECQEPEVRVMYLYMFYITLPTLK